MQQKKQDEVDVIVLTKYPSFYVLPTQTQDWEMDFSPTS